ncbi:MAG: DUF6504 family protein [Candidatus Nanopelagicales bacterium]
MRSYGEAVQVRTAPPGEAGPDERAPAQFLWRGRLYVVRAVLAHWIELGTWWASSGSRRRSPAAALPAPADPPLEPARRSVAFDVGAVEREVWRVEARAGRSSAVGVYDLVRDVPAASAALLDDPVLDLAAAAPARWRLARTLD